MSTTAAIPAPAPLDLDAAPAPWAHNPSSWRQRGTIALVAGIACAIAVYMGLYQWGLIGGVWDPLFGDQSAQVLDSEVSHQITRWVKIPDAILGALAYLGDVLFALAGSTRRWQFRPWLVVLFGLDVIPLGIVSALLVVAQGLVVGAWCFLCLVTAAISLVLVVLAYDEVWSCLRFLHRVRRRAGSGRALWDAFWGRPSAAAHGAGLDLTSRASC
jgi:Vitamin K epoxide reductase family